MFFFALSYNLYDNLLGENMIVLAHQNRDRMAICCASHTFKQWFTPLKVCYCCWLGGSGEGNENVKSLRTDGQRTTGDQKRLLEHSVFNFVCSGK